MWGDGEITLGKGVVHQDTILLNFPKNFVISRKNLVTGGWGWVGGGEVIPLDLPLAGMRGLRNDGGRDLWGWWRF